MTAPADPTTRFCGLDLEISRDVLVPREETELLARTAIALVGDARESPSFRGYVVDMCCGAGNLACALASAHPTLRVWASDLTAPCVALARRNVERLGLGARVDVRQGDLFAPLRELSPMRLDGAVDLVVCNPPYISSGKLAGESAHLLETEPREAFDAGPYGFAVHKRVIQDALAFLRVGGWLVFEIGKGQERQISSLFARARGYAATRTFCDSEGAVRVLAAERLASTPEALPSPHQA
jgi:HemK-like putative methylase